MTHIKEQRIINAFSIFVLLARVLATHLSMPKSFMPKSFNILYLFYLHHTRCNTVIQSWQDEDIKQTQDSLWQSPKPSNTLPHPINKTTTMAAANSVAKNLWNKETSELPTTIAASASAEPTTAKTLQTEHIIDLELNDAEKATDLNQNTKLTNRKSRTFKYN